MDGTAEDENLDVDEDKDETAPSTANDAVVRGERTTILLALLKDNRDEIVFWRNRNWSAFRSILAAMGVIASVSILKEGPLPFWLFVGFYVVILIVSGNMSRHVRHNRDKFAELQQERQRILDALGVTAEPARDAPSLPHIVQEPAHPDATRAFARLTFVLALILVCALVVKGLRLAGQPAANSLQQQQQQ
jgi:hypothetical protein